MRDNNENSKIKYNGEYIMIYFNKNTYAHINMCTYVYT